MECSEFKNGARSEFGYDGLANDTGDFGIGRIASVKHYRGSAESTLFDNRTMKWDASGNKTERVVKMNGVASVSQFANRTFAYEYDSVNRLAQSQITITPAPAGGQPKPRLYFLDGVGNRLSHGDFDMSGHVDAGDGDNVSKVIRQGANAAWATGSPWWRRMNVNGDAAVNGSDAGLIKQAAENCAATCLDWTRDKTDLPVDNPYVRSAGVCMSLNQYSRSASETALEYDANGNLIAARAARAGVDPVAAPAPRRTFQYDYANRLVRCLAFDDRDREVETAFAYDALGRRVQKTVKQTNDLGAVESSTVNFFYDGDQIIEETDDSLTAPGGGPFGGQTRATYINGLYVDEPLQMRRKGAPGAPDSVYYFHRDDLYSIVALTDSTGAVAERYDYDDYGAPTFLNPDGSVQLKADSTTEASNSSALNNRYLFTGREWDPELNLFFYRSRYYDPRMGRFTQIDSIGVWGDAGNVGNEYAYLANRPIAGLDPFGLMTWEWDGNLRNFQFDADLDWFTKGSVRDNIPYRPNAAQMEEIQTRAYANVAGFPLFPRAAFLLAHYLGNTGTPVTLDGKKMLRDNPEALTNIANDISKAADMIRSSPGRLGSIVGQPDPPVWNENYKQYDGPFGKTSGDWGYAIGNFYARAAGHVQCGAAGREFVVYIQNGGPL